MILVISRWVGIVAVSSKGKTALCTQSFTAYCLLLTADCLLLPGLRLAGLFLFLARPFFDAFTYEFAQVFDFASRFFPELFEHLGIQRKPVRFAESFRRTEFVFVVSG